MSSVEVAGLMIATQLVPPSYCNNARPGGGEREFKVELCGAMAPDDPNRNGIIRNIPDLFEWLNAGYNFGALDKRPGPVSIVPASIRHDGRGRDAQPIYLVSISGTELTSRAGSHDSFTGGVAAWTYTNLMSALGYDSKHVYNILYMIEDYFNHMDSRGVELYITGHSQGGMVAQQVAEIILENKRGSRNRYKNYRDAFGEGVLGGVSKMPKTFEGSVRKVFTLGSPQTCTPELSRSGKVTLGVCSGDPVSAASKYELSNFCEKAARGMCEVAASCLTCFTGSSIALADECVAEVKNYSDAEAFWTSISGDVDQFYTRPPAVEKTSPTAEPRVIFAPDGQAYQGMARVNPIFRHTGCYPDRTNPATTTDPSHVDPMGVPGGDAYLEVRDLDTRVFYTSPRW